MNQLNKKITNAVERPVKVVQFGEGNFLRGFVDYMIDIANEKTDFNGNVVILKAIEYGNLDSFKKQDCQYTLSLRGKENGRAVVENRIITAVADAVGIYEEYEKFMELARLDSVRFIVSNTTEAGIAYDASDSFEETPSKTYPGKLTKFMYERFRYYTGNVSKGLILIPCELIEDNGGTLKECVLKYAALWNLGEEFESWIQNACIFCSTLVDRIVTGYPSEEAKTLEQEFGYEDKLLDTGEIFALWVIESEKDISKELPLREAGLPVIFTEDQKPYRERKVRILNGAHTSFVLASYLAGNNLVLESMEDKTIRRFMEDTIYEEVIPTLSLPEEDCRKFAKDVIERFENPFVKHQLLSISLNSVSKWKSRCMPSLIRYVDKFHKIPVNLTFSIAALMAFYSSKEYRDGTLIGNRMGEEYKIMDDEKVLAFFQNHVELPVEEFVSAFLGRTEFFGRDLTRVDGLVQLVSEYLQAIREKGMRNALENVLVRR